MAVEDKLTGWLELVDATELIAPRQVEKVLQALGKGDENFECEGITWNDEGTIPMQMEVSYWTTNPPDFAEALDDVCINLATGEYLLFEEKVRYGLRTSTLRSILIAKGGVYTHDSSYTADLLKARAGLISLPGVSNDDGTELDSDDDDDDDDNGIGV